MIALELFAIFENGHYSAEQIYYYDSNSKKLANLFARARHKVFIFHRDHKNENFVFYFQMPYYYFKEQSPKNRNKKCFNLFLGLKIGKFIFDLVKGKQISCSRSLNFSF